MISTPAAMPASATVAFCVSSEMGMRIFAAQALEHRQHARQFLFGAHRIGAGTRGFAADVDHVGPRALQFERARDGRRRVQISCRRRKSCRA